MARVAAVWWSARRALWRSAAAALWPWAKKGSSASDDTAASWGASATNRYEGWKVAAGVATGIAVGTMLARPPRASTTVVVSGANYYYADGAYYEQVSYGGSVSYRVVTAPAGAIITTLPGSCTTTVMGGVAVQQCGPTYYRRVSTGYQVVVY